MNDNMVWAALIHEGCTAEMPLHVRPFSQLQTSLVSLGTTHSHTSPKLLTATFYPFNAEFLK